MLRRLQLRFRGMGFRPRAADQVPAIDLFRADTCLWAAASVSELSPLHVAQLGARGVLLALRTGEPSRVLAALCMEAINLAVAHGRGSGRLHRLMAQIERLAQQVGSPQARALTLGTDGVISFCQGHWRLAQECCKAAADLWRTNGGSMWEIVGAQKHGLLAQGIRGEMAGMACQYEALIHEANERGNKYAVANLGIYVGPHVYLLRDDPHGARQLLDRLTGHWPRQTFLFPHYVICCGQLHVDLYQNDGQAAWERLREAWPQFESAYLLHAVAIRVHLLVFRARAAVAAAAAGYEARRMLENAEHDCRSLRRLRLAWAEPWALSMQGLIARARGRFPEAVQLLTSAATAFERGQMLIYACAARHRLGELTGGERGQEMIRHADSSMARQGIVNPARTTAHLLPA
jgi:hypothetical protein